MWSYNQVKKTFTDYFINKGHTFVPESSLVPTNDNSLLFTNSGMVQFKDIFLGNTVPNYNTACNSQKCIRAGGKHNDLDDVGKDSYHHTMFNMLGNWSFNYDPNSNNNNSYFKKNAIDMAWDLLVNVYKLDKERIYVTYFGGNTELKLQSDDETKGYWKQYLPENRILPFGMKENFWEMGYTGPCGPCTEIHYDKLGNRDASSLVNRDDPTVIEIWNLVFMQFRRNEDGSLSTLGKQHVDTGAGLERLVSILQNCTNYEIDIFNKIINIIRETVDGPLYTNKYGSDDPKYIDMAYRVIADHTRTMILAINDGVVPSATERGYVVRRIIRRAVRYGTKLESRDGFLSKIVRNVIILMKDEYPELAINCDKITEIVSDEETKFSRVMRKGIRYFNKLTKDGNKEKVTMKQLFELYTSFGFPIDIIKQLCEEDGVKFDNNEYSRLMEEHVKISKEGKKFN
ncbi:alanyl-tRNA synthetase [Fadolivirus algeromassiliense]|jgi:alanyl-tRNA synthetase|uniref:alanine--tRNA ligase n=1 Tax=Fadolivirus FV1/VV64 TaxID=3070911 RepID=A0A7D3R157_9VIRU|nr:alanyl-tRNA synthetase [Fadolivirus algeromassiliense]QKF94222.1 alanyl-tRNA synthetase [Fadolivirus FV1/VV64]